MFRRLSRLAVLCASLAFFGFAPEAQAQATRQYATGNCGNGHCDVCGGGYCNGTDQSYTFTDTLGPAYLVTSVRIDIEGQSCFNGTATTYLNGAVVGSTVLPYECACGACASHATYSANYGAGFPGYVYGGVNTVRGVFPDIMSLARYRVTVTYIPRTPPSAGAGGPYTVSQGQNVTLSASASGGVPGYSYAWDLNNDGAYGEATGATPSVSWASFGGMGARTIRVRVTDALARQAFAASTVTVNNVGPSPSISWSPPNPAAGANVQFNGATGDPGDGSAYDSFTYAWDFGDGTTSTARNPVKAYTTAGPYTVRFTVRDSFGATATAVGTITSWGAKAGGPYVVSQGGSVTLAGSSPGNPAPAYAWDFDGDSYFNDSTAASPAVPWAAFGGTGVRTVRLRASYGGMSATDATTVTVVNVAPSPAFTYTPARPANGVAVQFNGTIDDPAEASGLESYSFAWDFGDGTVSTLRNPVKAFAAAGTYSVRYTVTDSNGGVGTFVGSVAVWGANAGGPYTVTQGATITLNGSVPNEPPGTTYTWDLNGDGVFGDATIARPTVAWSAFGGLGIRIITLRIADASFTSTGTTTVTVTNAPPVPSFVTSPAVPPRGAPVAFTVATGDAGEPSGRETYTFAWTFGDGATSSDRNPSHTYANPGTYAVRVTVTDSNGAAGSVTRNVVVWAAGAGGPYAVADGRTVQLAASAANAPGPVAFAWDLDDDGLFDDAAGAAPTLASTAFGGLGLRRVQVRATDAQGGVSFAPTTVSVWDADAGGPYRVAQGETVQLRAATTGAGFGGALTHRWDLDADGAFDDATGATPTLGWSAFGRVVGTRPVTLQITDGTGAIATASSTVLVTNVAPTASPAFTPDPPKIGELVRFTGTFTDPGSDAEAYSFRWDFGDGTSSTTQSPTKTYLDPRPYTVTFTVTDPFGGVGRFTREIAVVNVPPAVSVADASGRQMTAIALKATVTSLSPANTAAGFDVAWDFGDGSAVVRGRNLFQPTHVYADAGSYTVRVTATDVHGSATVATAKVTSEVVPPTVVLPDVAGREGRPVSFAATVTHVSAVTARAGYSTKWEWGDGTPALEGRDVLAPSKVFDDGGEYTVRLTVVDKNGGTTVVQAKARIRDDAPVVVLEPVRAAAAGARVQFAAKVTSRSEATQAAGYRIAWNFGDGATASEALVQEHAYCAARTYTVTVTATDKDGMQGLATAQVPVTNTAPRIVSVPPALATEGAKLEYAVAAVQPGCETLSYEVRGPEAMTVSPGGLVEWTPRYEDFGRHEVFVTVRDGSGGRAEQAFVLAVEYRDGDHDGLPDSWEERYGLDPTDPRTPFESPAGDGRTNLEKWKEELDPTLSEAPGPIAAIAPDEGATTPARPRLEVAGPDAETEELAYEFEVYEDPTLERPVVAAGGSARGLGGASFDVPVTLQEDRAYWWRARASDGFGTSPWTAARRLFVSAVDHAPPAPPLLLPMAGATVATLAPALNVVQVRDPEGQPVAYEFEIHADPSLSGAIAAGRGALDGERGVWTPSEPLADDAWFFWRARAVDEGGHASSWSAPSSFRVLSTVRAPAKPQFVAPLDGARVTIASPLLTVGSAPGAGTTVAFAIDTVPTFDGPALQESGALAQERFFTSWTAPQPLADHTKYYWRAVASDGALESEPLVASFTVNLTEVAPEVPAPASPLDGAEVSRPITLTLTNTTDRNGDAITYDFELYTRDGGKLLARRSAVAAGEGTTTWVVEDATPISDGFSWRARAVDATGLASEWSAPQKFRILAVPVGGCAAAGGSLAAVLGLTVLAARRRRRGA